MLRSFQNCSPSSFTTLMALRSFANVAHAESRFDDQLAGSLPTVARESPHASAWTHPTLTFRRVGMRRPSVCQSTRQNDHELGSALTVGAGIDGIRTSGNLGCGTDASTLMFIPLPETLPLAPSLAPPTFTEPAPETRSRLNVACEFVESSPGDRTS